MQLSSWLKSRETPGTIADVARRVLEKDAKYKAVEKTLQGMYVLEMLMRHEGHIANSAKAMGVSRMTVQRVLRSLGLSAKNVRDAAKRIQEARNADHAA